MKPKGGHRVQIPKINPNHRRRVPKQSKRNDFSKKVRDRIIERDDGKCRNCGAIGSEIHHVVFRSQGGRGVYTNGLLVCHHCHRRIHEYKILANKWVFLFEKEYGKDFYKDEWD